MSDILERLRRLQQLRPQRSRSEPELPPQREPYAGGRYTSEPQVDLDTELYSEEDDLDLVPVRLEDLAGGREIHNQGGECFVRQQVYPVNLLRGTSAFADLLPFRPATLADLHPQFRLHPALDFAQAAFIDTETTGLGGGASVYPFMIGVGTFESLTPHSDLVYVVRQFFMRHPGEESAALAGLAQVLEDRSFTVTFNGRTFDLPLLRTRYFFNRGLVGDSDMPFILEEDGAHLDLLHPARRLWKRRLQSCRLTNLEQKVLGLQRSHEDVPGHLIPQFYTDYLQSGDARMMERVFYHNCEDILSMVGLAWQIYATFQPTGQGEMGMTLSTAKDGYDWLALAVAYETRNEWAIAEDAYRQAVAQLNDAAALAEGFDRLGLLLKRFNRWQEAAECWERWLTTAPGASLTPYLELAKYCEWQLNDLEQAEMWTRWAIHTLQANSEINDTRRIQTELEHRLQRIGRKRER